MKKGAGKRGAGMFSRKGQAEKVFMYAVTLIIVAMILLFGYKAIVKVVSHDEMATTAQFINTLRNRIDTGSSYGRISTEDFTPGERFKAICFVVEEDPDDLNEELLRKYPWAADVAESEDNVFLYDGETINPFKIDPFEIDKTDKYAYGPDALCIPIMNGDFSIRIEGLGDRTRITS